MAIKEIARLGHPVLRQRAQPLSGQGFPPPDLPRLVADMTETMREAHGVGIAAPQIHELKRVIGLEIRPDNRYGVTDLVDLLIVVDPEIESLTSRTAVHWEGCLSIPGLRGPVMRSQDVVLRGIDPDDTPIERELHDFPAIVMQHELDHLNGTLFIDRMTDVGLLSFENEYHRFHEDEAALSRSAPRENPGGVL